jgi:hypothetical protein
MASQSQAADGIPSGQARPQSTWGEFNNISFLVQQALSKMQTATLVRVDACTNTGGVSPVGFVDVTPLVNQLDSQGNPTPHVTIHNVPYLRMQGGANAVIIDPQPGDIGMCAFASRDITKVKSQKVQSNPGSFRQYSFADAMYLGGMLNAAPTQYVQFSAAGIKLHSPVAVILEAPTVDIECATLVINATESTTITTPIFTVNGDTNINGNTTVEGDTTVTGVTGITGTLAVTGDVTANGVSVHNHVHSGVTAGGANTGAPV